MLASLGGSGWGLLLVARVGLFLAGEAGQREGTILTLIDMHIRVKKIAKHRSYL